MSWAAVERQLKTLNNFLPLNQWSNLAIYVTSGTVTAVSNLSKGTVLERLFLALCS